LQKDISSNVSHFSSVQDFISSHTKNFEINSNDLATLRKLDKLVPSSYSSNSYSILFYFVAKFFKPKTVVEFGVLGCYSIISMGLGVKNENIAQSVIGYDLFEDYEFTSFALKDAIARVEKFNLTKIIKLKKANALEGSLIENALKNNDLIHIDLSNEGNLFNRILSANFKKGSIIILEGGSIERDEETWIKKYGAKEIYPVIKKFQEIRNDITISVIDAFPSVTIIQT
jgi:predicted O-methyltransferase YrrM